MKQFIFAAALIFGISLILFQKQLSHFLSSSENRDKSPLAQVESFSGQVTRRTPQTLQSVEITPGDQIHDQDTLEVGNNSQATIKFLSGLVVSLNADTVIYFELADGIFVTFKKGDYKILNAGKAGEKIFFVRDGMVSDPLGRNISKPITIKTEEVPTGEPGETPREVQLPKDKESISPSRSAPLTDAQITLTLSKMRGFFSNCYAQLLKESPDAKGQLYFSTTIQNNGQPSQTRVIQSSIQSDSLKNCLVQVVDRTIFERFEGDPIVVNFPIYLE